MPHRCLTLGTLECTMFLGPGVTDDTAMHLSNNFLKDEVGWRNGRVVIVNTKNRDRGEDS